MSYGYEGLDYTVRDWGSQHRFSKPQSTDMVPLFELHHIDDPIFVIDEISNGACGSLSYGDDFSKTGLSAVMDGSDVDGASFSEYCFGITKAKHKQNASNMFWSGVGFMVLFFVIIACLCRFPSVIYD